MIMKDMDLSLIGETAAILTCMHAPVVLFPPGRGELIFSCGKVDSFE